jgi:hypothetical protein
VEILAKYYALWPDIAFPMFRNVDAGKVTKNLTENEWQTEPALVRPKSHFSPIIAHLSIQKEVLRLVAATKKSTRFSWLFSVEEAYRNQHPACRPWEIIFPE